MAENISLTLMDEHLLQDLHAVNSAQI